jgi:hypothetical protein
MKKLPAEYYIEEDYAVLAGPYAYGNKKDNLYKQRVIDDLNRGGIPWRILQVKDNDYIERKGMILPKRTT